MLLVSQVSAVYDFEGIPFKTVAQGEVTGNVLVFAEYGLRNPPITLEFDVPYEIQWARTYVGVWGGTPRYTGWVQTTVNDQPFEKLMLYGQDDRTPNVYCTGYGVYWVAYDTTALCVQGHNTIVARTSLGEPENKLDGRIYGVMTVLVVKDPKGGNTQYWVFEGNENLHGEGWSGLNPTQHEEATVSIPVPDTAGLQHANLTVVYLTSTRGQPDYLQFNGQDLGPVVSGPNYPEGARDIADERSFNAGYTINGGIDGRYFDIEIFDITSLVKSGRNDVTFFRGRDLDGDGIITETGEKPEGEDYLHPVNVILTLQKPRPEATTPDLTIRQIDLKNAFEGESATIAVTIENLGIAPSSPAELKVSIDGTSISTQQVTIEKSGVQQVSVPWQTVRGTHVVRAEITMEGDSDRTNNAAEKQVTVGTLPDLSVSVDKPVRPGSGGSTAGAPLPAPLVLISLGVAAVIFAALQHRRPPKRPVLTRFLSVAFIALLLSAGILTVPAPVSAADTSSSLYLLPVTVKNIGGSDAPAFSLTLYLDGEKIATKSYDTGIIAGDTIQADIPIHTLQGSHMVKIVIDEEEKVRDADRRNNVVETTFVFS
ncbi:MAG: DUF3344 domain-containing protein [Methanoregulaceae archaeon]